MKLFDRVASLLRIIVIGVFQNVLQWLLTSLHDMIGGINQFCIMHGEDFNSSVNAAPDVYLNLIILEAISGHATLFKLSRGVIYRGAFRFWKEVISLWKPGTPSMEIRIETRFSTAEFELKKK